MKHTSVTVLLSISVFLVATPFSWGKSNVRGAVINTPGKINKNVNVAIGNRAKARQSSVSIKSLDMIGAAVNAARGKTNINVAVGNKVEANQASMKLGGKLRGAAINTNMVKKNINVAVGN